MFFVFFSNICICTLSVSKLNDTFAKILSRKYKSIGLLPRRWRYCTFFAVIKKKKMRKGRGKISPARICLQHRAQSLQLPGNTQYWRNSLTFCVIINEDGNCTNL